MTTILRAVLFGVLVVGAWTQGDTSGSGKERIMFGKLERVER